MVYTTLYFLGNGFDLAHRMATRYMAEDLSETRGSGIPAIIRLFGGSGMV